MTEGRGLLTDREREALAGDDTDNYRYKTRTYFRRRLEKLAGDVEHLAEHDPELLEELRAVVCESTAEPAAGRAEAPEPTTDDEHDAIHDVVEAVADGWDDPAERLEARKAAARAVLRYAREHGTVSKQEAKDEIRPEHPVDGQSERTWYRKNVRPVLNEAGEYDTGEQAYRLALK